MVPEVVFFKAPAELRAWFREHLTTATELWIGFYKKDSGHTGVTYQEALDEALCVGWIDGIRKSVDKISYTNRFTPRKPKSNWSRVNIERVEELIKLRRMKKPGLAAFEACEKIRSGVYTYENKVEDLSALFIRQFKSNRKAWTYFQMQPPGYRRTAGRWVMSAKKEETRLRRLTTLIEDSAHERRIGPLRRPRRTQP